MDIKPPLASGANPQSTGISPTTELPASLQQLPRGTLLTAVVESSRPTAPQAANSQSLIQQFTYSQPTNSQPLNPQATNQQTSNPQATNTQSSNLPTASQTTPTTTANKSFDVLLNISGNKIQTLSNVAFNPGQLLKVEITANAALRVIQVAAQQAPQLNQPLQQIQQGLRQALPLQQSPALLLNNLTPLFKLLDVTPAVQAKAQIRELLSTIPDFKQLSNPSVLKNSVSQSGIFLESKIKLLQTQIQQLLQSTPQNTQNKPLQQQFNSAAPVNIRSQTSTSNTATTQHSQTNNTREMVQNLLRDNVQFSKQLEKLVGQDFKAQLLKLSSALIPLLSRTDSANTARPAEAALIQRILQVLPDTSGAQSLSPSGARQTSLSLSHLPITTQIIQLLNANLIPGQQPLQATPGQLNNSTDLAVSTVLRQIAATLSQVQANQLQSLTGPRAEGDGGLLLNSWNIEIPVFLEGQFKPIQLQINEERHPEASAQEHEKTRVWKITLSFDFEELGEFFTTLRIIDNNISATFWSEKPETLQRISSELQHLNKSLHKLGLNVEELECRRGKPRIRETRLDQQLVDIKT